MFKLPLLCQNIWVWLPLFCVQLTSVLCSITFCSLFSLTLFFDQFTFVLWSVCLCSVVSFSPWYNHHGWPGVKNQWPLHLCSVHLCSVFSLPLFCVQFTFVLYSVDLCSMSVYLCSVSVYLCDLFTCVCVLSTSVLCFVFLCYMLCLPLCTAYLCC